VAHAGLWRPTYHHEFEHTSMPSGSTKAKMAEAHGPGGRRLRRRSEALPGREQGLLCFAPCHGLISVASLVRRDTLLWSSFARPLITALVGITLLLII
jgi:hypothetical protein